LNRLEIGPTVHGAATRGGFLPSDGPELDVHSPIDGARLSNVALGDHRDIVIHCTAGAPAP
jgi:hypothetical protein